MKSRFMERALKLAAKAQGNTSPNPMVGAVIVKAGKIIAEGYHAKAGKDHAEVAALKKAKAGAKGSTIYITLEPCCHKGKTGPCADALITAGVSKVVIAMRDPNPLVAGKGVARLKKAGIIVLEGLLHKEAKKLNAHFEKFITQKLPYTTLKAAISLDGKIAASTGQSKWISNELSRKRVHEMRALYDAIMVGVNTVLADDPKLNVRPLKKGTKQPLRVIVDTKLKTPPTAKILHSTGGKVLIASSKDAPHTRIKKLEDQGAEIICLPSKDGKVNLRSLMIELAKREVVSVMLEGGSSLYTEALSSGVVDSVALFTAPIIIGGDSKFSVVNGKGVKTVKEALKLRDVTYKQFGENMLVEGEIQN